MYCYCNECPQEIPRKETVVFTCAACANLPEGWMDVNIILGRCDKCGKHGFCHAEEKKVEPEWQL